MSDEFNKQIGLRIRARRELLGMTREKLCTFVAISPQFLSEIERGVKGLSAETLFKLCDGLKMSADYTLTGKEQTADVSGAAAIIANLDEKYIPLAEELLRAFVKTIALK